MDLDIDPDEKHMVMMEKLMYMLGKRIERYEANLNIDNLEQLMLLLDREQTQPIQDMYDEQDYRENNEEKLLIMMEKMMYILGKRIERCEANLNIVDLEQPMSFPDQTQAQSPQDLDNEQDMYDDQDFMEDNEKD